MNVCINMRLYVIYIYIYIYIYCICIYCNMHLCSDTCIYIYVCVCLCNCHLVVPGLPTPRYMSCAHIITCACVCAVVTNIATNRGSPPQLFGFHLDFNHLDLLWASTMWIFSDFSCVWTYITILDSTSELATRQKKYHRDYPKIEHTINVTMDLKFG
jgi:hypothetical protein